MIMMRATLRIFVLGLFLSVLCPAEIVLLNGAFIHLSGQLEKGIGVKISDTHMRTLHIGTVKVPGYDNIQVNSAADDYHGHLLIAGRLSNGGGAQGMKFVVLKYDYLTKRTTILIDLVEAEIVNLTVAGEKIWCFVHRWRGKMSEPFVHSYSLKGEYLSGHLPRSAFSNMYSLALSGDRIGVAALTQTVGANGAGNVWVEMSSSDGTILSQTKWEAPVGRLGTPERPWGPAFELSPEVIVSTLSHRIIAYFSSMQAAQNFGEGFYELNRKTGKWKLFKLVNNDRFARLMGAVGDQLVFYRDYQSSLIDLPK